MEILSIIHETKTAAYTDIISEGWVHMRRIAIRITVLTIAVWLFSSIGPNLSKQACCLACGEQIHMNLLTETKTWPHAPVVPFMGNYQDGHINLASRDMGSTFHSDAFVFAAANPVQNTAVTGQGQEDTASEENFRWLALSLLVLVYAASITAIICLTLYRRKLERELRKAAFTDKTTGCANLSKFQQDATALFRTQPQEHYTVLYFDVVKFGYINDIFGYETGDAVLRYIAGVLERCVHEGEAFARTAADSFVALLLEQQEDLIIARAQEIMSGIRAYTGFRTEYYELTACCGAYRIKPGDMLFEAIDRASAACRSVTGRRQDTVAFYTQAMHERKVWEREMESAMKGALQREEFRTYLQPKLNLNNRRMFGAEALVRWDFPGKGILSPLSFVPFFEQNGFIVELDLYVFEQVCSNMRQWKAEGKRLFPISVNVSRKHFGDMAFVQQYKNIAQKYRISPTLLELELTEYSVYNNYDFMRDAIRQLKEIGFRISMDDFGAGYSSLSLLREIPVDIVKIDKRFFAKDDNSKRSRIIIKSIVDMCRQLGITVIAEGVEQEQQAAFLAETGCYGAQGYLFAMPEPIERFADYEQI